MNAGLLEASPRAVLRFLGAAGLVYAAFMGPWPGLDSASATLWRGMGTAVTRAFGFGDGVFLEPAPRADSRTDSSIRLVGLRAVPGGGAPEQFRIPLSTRHLCASPVVLFLALVAASPVPWARKRRAVLVGIPLVAGFVAVRIVLMALTILIQADLVGTFVTSPSLRAWLGVFGILEGGDSLKRWSAHGADLFCGISATAFLIPVLIWGLVTFGSLERIHPRWRLSASEKGSS